MGSRKKAQILYIYIDLSLSVTCVFEGSLKDACKEFKLLAGKGLVSSVASFHSLWSLLSHSYFYECASSTDGL